MLSPDRVISRSCYPQVVLSPSRVIPRSCYPQIALSPGRFIPRSSYPQVVLSPGKIKLPTTVKTKFSQLVVSGHHIIMTLLDKFPRFLTPSPVPLHKHFASLWNIHWTKIFPLRDCITVNNPVMDIHWTKLYSPARYNMNNPVMDIHWRNDIPPARLYNM